MLIKQLCRPFTSLRSGKQDYTNLQFWSAVILLITAITPASGWAQHLAADNLDGAVFKKGRIYLADDTRLEARHLTVSRDSIRFVEAGTKIPSIHSLTNVKLVKVVDGTRTLEYALFGAGVGATTISIAALKAKSNSDYDELNQEVNYAAVILGFTAATTLVAAAIGAFRPRWRTLDIVQQNVLTSQAGYSTNLVVNSGHVGVQITVSL